MAAFAAIVAGISLLVWVLIALYPGRPWSVEPCWNAELSDADTEADLSEITVLIPARNERTVIDRTLPAVLNQGRGAKVILVDDQSTDGTGARADEIGGGRIEIVWGTELPEGWSGKLWALEQARMRAHTPLLVLLDADIELDGAVLIGMRKRLMENRLSFVSLMAIPAMKGGWEKLLMPAFVYFFKLLYPFRMANSMKSQVAAAAGGFIMIEASVLEAVGGFGGVRAAIIDDCTLAARIKSKGYLGWLGLTQSIRSTRSGLGLASVWEMVARTAFTQLSYSIPRLLFCSFVMLLAFWAPPVLIFFGYPVGAVAGLTLLIMIMTYIPILGFYNRSFLWAAFLPVIGALYLAMTWTSAIRYWRGERSRWKGRAYRKTAVGE